jgi:hypothetical protein
MSTKKLMQGAHRAPWHGGQCPPQVYSDCQKFFPLREALKSPLPPFKKGGKCKELLLKSPFFKGGFRNLQKEGIYGKRYNSGRFPVPAGQRQWLAKLGCAANTNLLKVYMKQDNRKYTGYCFKASA